MRVLITGSEGVLGKPLVAQLTEQGHEVWRCDLHHADGPTYVRADVANRRQLGEVFRACVPDAVYHLAAEFGRLNGEGWYEQLWQTAAIGTRNMLELCEHYESRLLFASSSEVYGEAEAELLDEDLTEREVILHPNEYALSKWTNERQIMAYQQRNPKLEAYRLRFFNAYGPGEAYHPYRSVVAQFCHRALRDESLPVFRGYHRTFMYIDDFIPTLANACEAVLHYPVYNIGGADYRSVEELAELVIDEIGAGEIELIGEDVHNVRSKRPAIGRANDDLAHDPSVRLEEGVPPTAAWMQERVLA